MDPTILDKYGRLAFQAADFKTILLPNIIGHLERSFLNDFDVELFNSEYVNKVVTFLKRNEEKFSKISDLIKGDFRFFFARSNSTEKILSKFSKQLAMEFIGNFFDFGISHLGSLFWLSQYRIVFNSKLR